MTVPVLETDPKKKRRRRKRGKRVQLRITVGLSLVERDELNARAKALGLKRADYMRRAALGLRLRPQASQAKIAAVNRVGGNLNQSARALNILTAQARSQREREAVIVAAEAVMLAAQDVRVVVAALREDDGGEDDN